MREIKFRVWTGCGMEHDVLVGNLGAFYHSGISENDAATLDNCNTIYPSDTPVMQFTGLTDKNGKEIYEGDVVIYDKSPFPNIDDVFKGIIVWDKDLCCFGINEDVLMEDVNYAHFEIIGNIYENPELLEVE